MSSCWAVKAPASELVHRTVAAWIGRSPGRTDSPPLRRSSVSVTPWSSTCQKAKAPPRTSTPKPRVLPVAVSCTSALQGSTASGRTTRHSNSP
ncbi:hypothetical protein QE392_001280 [Microbacterium proteolyticum]|nr:hypothetical protein [Microbacterium sp. SORGH_AS_0344]MDQ1169476.1 hypothetical protein [Microbacterium proteolyticum]